jgi:hypothetical protein
MGDTDPQRLADRFEGEADAMEHQADKVQGAVEEARQDWQRKRADQSVPGAPPEPEERAEPDEQSSPGPEAPPEESAPGEAETAAEGGAGPPADTGNGE